ncbi:MAG: lipid-binding SYLF domain-containing protein [Desulfobacteraceae bacterium]|nr:lipid-binding SYLF domain-containing protein [Desulfobacteraceae bacterium]
MPIRTIMVIVFAACLFVTASAPEAGVSEEAKVQAATAVLKEVMEIPESAIPPSLLGSAYGIAIFPDLLKAGFILGGRYGQGVLLVRSEGDRAWSNPVFFKLMGGSIGWQIGAQSSDIILVLKSIRSLDSITSGKFTLGVDASIAAGPVGRHAEAGTDVQLRAEILSYSRSRGLFLGLSLEGASMQVDYGANAAFYNVPGLLPMEIFRNRNLPAPPVSEELRRTLTHFSNS